VQRLALARQRLQERGLVVRAQRDGPALGAEHLEHVLEQNQQPLVQPARLGGLPGFRVEGLGFRVKGGRVATPGGCQVSDMVHSLAVINLYFVSSAAGCVF
jgi:hypothetical protein